MASGNDSGRGPSVGTFVEIVEIDSGEVVLFWDCPPHAASRLARTLREEMALLEADEFLARWSAYEQASVDADADTP